MRECVEKSYGHIRYELPFIGALCVDVPEENTAAVLKLRGITAATEDMKVTKFDAQESSKPCMVNAEADSLGRDVSIAVLDTGTHPHYDLIKPYNRLGISGIEIAIRNLGKEANINKVHPHKFRRTMATMAIDKGMTIEQVQKLLGHIKIDTTMEYAMVNQNNVKNSHRKYIT